MTTYEFDTLMNVVYSRWGDKNYPMVVRERIWYFVRELPQKSFEKMIYILIDTQRAAPMPNEFKMLAYGEKDALGIKGNKEPEGKQSCDAKCWDCGDSGNLFVRHKIKNSSGVVRCHCPVGSSRPRNQGLQWSDVVAKTYAKEPVFQFGQGNWKPQPDQSGVQMVNALRSLPCEAKRESEPTPVATILKIPGRKSSAEPDDTVDCNE